MREGDGLKRGEEMVWLRRVCEGRGGLRELVKGRGWLGRVSQGDSKAGNSW